jgi:ribosomal protein S18 acetylase RimI-like enzyme
VSVAVRRATVEDADAIGAVHLASWRVAYRDAAPEGWLQTQTRAERTESWHRHLTAAESTRAFVAVDGDDDATVVGFSGLEMPGRDFDSDAGPRTAEIATLYVDPSRWRMGAGRELMAASLGEFVDLGFTTATLWVLEANTRARAFYAAAGFTADGARRRSGGWPVEIRLRRSLSPFTR